MKFRKFNRKKIMKGIPKIQDTYFGNINELIEQIRFLNSILNTNLQLNIVKGKETIKQVLYTSFN